MGPKSEKVRSFSEIASVALYDPRLWKFSAAAAEKDPAAWWFAYSSDKSDLVDYLSKTILTHHTRLEKQRRVEKQKSRLPLRSVARTTLSLPLSVLLGSSTTERGSAFHEEEGEGEEEEEKEEEEEEEKKEEEEEEEGEDEEEKKVVRQSYKEMKEEEKEEKRLSRFARTTKSLVLSLRTIVKFYKEELSATIFTLSLLVPAKDDKEIRSIFTSAGITTGLQQLINIFYENPKVETKSSPDGGGVQTHSVEFGYEVRDGEIKWVEFHGIESPVAAMVLFPGLFTSPFSTSFLHWSEHDVLSPLLVPLSPQQERVRESQLSFGGDRGSGSGGGGGGIGGGGIGERFKNTKVESTTTTTTTTATRHSPIKRLGVRPTTPATTSTSSSAIHTVFEGPPPLVRQECCNLTTRWFNCLKDKDDDDDDEEEEEEEEEEKKGATGGGGGTTTTVLSRRASSSRLSTSSRKVAKSVPEHCRVMCARHIIEMIQRAQRLYRRRTINEGYDTKLGKRHEERPEERELPSEVEAGHGDWTETDGTQISVTVDMVDNPRNTRGVSNRVKPMGIKWDIYVVASPHYDDGNHTAESFVSYLDRRVKESLSSRFAKIWKLWRSLDRPSTLEEKCKLGYSKYIQLDDDDRLELGIIMYLDPMIKPVPSLENIIYQLVRGSPASVWQWLKPYMRVYAPPCESPSRIEPSSSSSSSPSSSSSSLTRRVLKRDTDLSRGLTREYPPRGSSLSSSSSSSRVRR